MAKTICFANLKGGVGKTTSTLNIGVCLAKKDYRVCLIDLDPQANLTISLGLDCTDPSTYKFIVKNLTFQKVKKQLTDKLSILPSHLSLIRADAELATTFEREQILNSKLTPFKKEFDFILIDCPPNIGTITINGIMTSDYIFTPVESEFLALQGLSILRKTITGIKRDVDKIFLTKYDQRKVLNRNIFESLSKSCPTKLMQTKIRDNITIAESQNNGVDVFSYDAKSHGAEDYQSLTEEILKYIKRE